MKILFLLHEHAVSYNYIGGGSARFAMYIECLNKLNHDIHICRFFSSNEINKKVNDWENKYDQSFKNHLKNIVSSWDDINYELNEYEHQNNRFSILNGILDPLKYSLRLRKDLFASTKGCINRVSPDIIWANHIIMSSVIALINPKISWLTSHHDWLYKLRSLKKPKFFDNYKQKIKYNLETLIQKKVEISIVQKSNCSITGSKTELNEIKYFGNSNAILIPSCFEKIKIPKKEYSHNNSLQILHIGGISTTANRIGLENYFKMVYPSIMSADRNKIKYLKTVIIGSMEKASKEMKANFNKKWVECLGYVRNLHTVINPYDIAIIPYHINTGIRTKVAIYFAHKLVVIAVKDAVLGFPKLSNGENIILIDKLEDMPSYIFSLSDNMELRKKIGENAKSTYNSYLTWENQVESIDKVLKKIK